MKTDKKNPPTAFRNCSKRNVRDDDNNNNKNNNNKC
jgi:hypothetical protein